MSITVMKMLITRELEYKQLVDTTISIKKLIKMFRSSRTQNRLRSLISRKLINII